MKYNIKYEEMPPQTTVGGKTKLDKQGNPLKSIRIKQSIEQRREMLKRMALLHKLYTVSPHYWPTTKQQVGNDPVKYTPQQMFEDFEKRITGWRGLSNNDLYKSFVDRHNYLLDCFIEYIGKNKIEDNYDLAELAEYNCRITLKEKDEVAIKLRATLMTSDIFDVE